MANARGRTVMIAAGLLVVLAGGLVLANVLGQDDTDPEPADGGSTFTPSPTASSTALSPRAEVREAYLDYWDVFATAFRSLNIDDVDEVVTGNALRVLSRQARELRDKGLFVRVRVQHDIRQIRLADATTAVVVDRLTNHSVTVDRATGKPTEKDPDEVIVEAYTLKKEDGKWKVSAISRRSVRRADR